MSNVDHSLKPKLAADAIVRIHREMRTLSQLSPEDLLEAKLKNEDNGEAIEPLMILARLSRQLDDLRCAMRNENWLRKKGGAA